MKNKIILSFFIIVSLALTGALFLQRNDSELTKTELYFGLSKPDGTNISKEEWNAFADSVISKVFSNGLTTVETRGEWRENESLLVHEESRIVISLNEMNSTLSSKIDTVREKYKRYFNQSSVLRVEYPVKASF